MAALSAATAPLLDDLVGGLKLHRHIEAERLGGFEIDCHFEFVWGLDRKLVRLCAFEDAIGIYRRMTKIVGQVSSVGQQAAEFGKETVRIDSREAEMTTERTITVKDYRDNISKYRGQNVYIDTFAGRELVGGFTVSGWIHCPKANAGFGISYMVNDTDRLVVA